MEHDQLRHVDYCDAGSVGMGSVRPYVDPTRLVQELGVHMCARVSVVMAESVLAQRAAPLAHAAVTTVRIGSPGRTASTR